jgi:hypothetical protein
VSQRNVILLIEGDGHGNPKPGSRSGYHFVCLSVDALPHVAQMHDGGQYPDTDCAVACLQSWALFLTGTRIDTRTLEREMGTTPSYGTTLQGIVRAATAHGIGAHVVVGDTADAGYVMNPAYNAGSIAPSGADQYLAASTGQMVVITTTQQTGGTTPPTTGTIEENDLTPAQAEQLQQVFNRTTELDSLAQRVLDLHNEITALRSMEDRVLAIQQDVAALKAKKP